MVTTRAASKAVPTPPQSVGTAKKRTKRRKRSSATKKAKKVTVSAPEPTPTVPLEPSAPSEPGPSTEPQRQRLPPKPTDVPSYPRCPRSGKWYVLCGAPMVHLLTLGESRSDAAKTMTTRTQVMWWTWFQSIDAIEWFDHIKAFCRDCNMMVTLSKRSDYDPEHWRKHWERHHPPLKVNGNQPGTAKGPPRKRRKRLASKARRTSRPQKREVPPTPDLSSDDSDRMDIDSDATPLPETPRSPPTIQLSETHPNVKRRREEIIQPASHWRTPSPCSSVVPEVRVIIHAPDPRPFA
ncbi:hypothetical protein L226DRAFT_106929 [Lentinus tigrinus ALCF2SS1-7]|uniref:uncharacterized protein n=1 Tax=Lentinus tigrinus ALCF2SS1-7 TaxID=1328758 RepID=UPI001165D795|nr:hypothetical protein L226DRAFT_106929 [Lentinus tigrinus ALCF2SS1-7]